MDKIDKKYGETPDKMTGTPDGSKPHNYGQTSNHESFKDRVADKIDNAATKMADKVHEKVEHHKSGTTDSSNRTGKTVENCGCGVSDKSSGSSGCEKPEQGKTSY